MEREREVEGDRRDRGNKGKRYMERERQTER